MKISFIFRIGMLFMGILLTIASNAQESYHLFTDRNMYVIGEAIHFSTVNTNEGDSAERVLYVELITPEGRQINGGKYLVENGMTRGCMDIPEDLLSGYYYIRAYTRTMRNYGPLTYAYVPLKVINPFKSNILASGNESSYEKDSLISGPFRFSNMKTHYRQREKVEFAISKNSDYQSVKGTNITIVPEQSVNDYYIQLNGSKKVIDSSEIYFSEKRGVSLTGKLMDKDQKVPVSGRVVTLSVMGEKDFSGYKTDRNGRFFFTLPDDTGKRDIFLSSADYNSAGTGLFIDNDFCTRPVNLPATEIKLTREEKELGLKLAVNARISKEFRHFIMPHADSVTGNEKPFYGEPTGILYMDKFIQLPTLREYFDEISLEVRIKERNEGYYFKFLSTDASMMAYDPLILVDWVAINDMEKLLSLLPQKILRIETVNKPYVKGNLTYGGIISIISKDGDFAGIDLPATGIFVKYDFFAPACPQPDTMPVARNIPDARSTLLWIPDYQFNSSKENTITFDTPDTPGSYEIYIRGVYSDGRVFGQSVGFEVMSNE